MYGDATRLESSINHLKHSFACKIKYSALGLDANKALGFAASQPHASYFIFHIALAAML